MPQYTALYQGGLVGQTAFVEKTFRVKIRPRPGKAFRVFRVRFHIYGASLELESITGLAYLVNQDSSLPKTFPGIQEMTEEQERNDAWCRCWFHSREQSAAGFAERVTPVELSYPEGHDLVSDQSLKVCISATNIPALWVAVELIGLVVDVDKQKVYKAKLK